MFNETQASSLPVQQQPPVAQSSGTRAELLVGLVLTAIVIGIHGARLSAAGGLWRDEAGAVQLATLPTFSDVISNFPHEAFPLVFPATVRTYAALTGGGDPAWRLFGFLVGIGLIGALWWTFWAMRLGAPLLSLALLGFNASFVQWGDSIRGYGLGTLLMLITLGLVWRVLEKPSVGRMLAAMVSAVAAVQCLFQNSPLLLAICAGAAAAAWMGGNRRTAGLVLGIGVPAALSLLPYLGLLHSAREWDMVVRGGASLPVMASELQAALSSSGWWMATVWEGLTAIGAAMVLYRLSRLRTTSLERPQTSVLLFSGIALVAGIVGYFGFLLTLGYPTKPWYYLALLGLIAMLLDLIAASFDERRRAQTLRIFLAVGVTAISVLPAWRLSGVRMTNIDLIAGALSQAARAGDLIVVTPWHNGISFYRYYHGPAHWETIPPISFLKFHRYDLIKAQMMARDQTQPVSQGMAAAQAALREGHRVWLVTDLRLLPHGASVPLPPPAPAPGWGWRDDLYSACWSAMAVAFLHATASHVEKVNIAIPGPVSRYEEMELWMFEGWAPSRQ